MFHEQRDKCAHVAARLASDLAKYFDAPGGRVQFAELDEDLRRKGELKPIHALPKMTMVKDGRWHCGIDLHFETTMRPEYGSVTLEIGVAKRQGKEFTIAWICEFEVDFAQPQCLNAVLEFIYSDLMESYARGAGEPRSTIGFVRDGEQR